MIRALSKSLSQRCDWSFGWVLHFFRHDEGSSVFAGQHLVCFIIVDISLPFRIEVEAEEDASKVNGGPLSEFVQGGLESSPGGGQDKEKTRLRVTYSKMCARFLRLPSAAFDLEPCPKF